jgi:chromosomal replication initiation ATPase DnaA
MIAALEFTNAASLKAHYAALNARKHAQLRNIVSRELIDKLREAHISLQPKTDAPYIQPSTCFDLEDVVASVIWVTCVSRDDLIGRSRVSHIMAARKVLFYLAAFHTDLNLVAIGRGLGGFDRTSILHSRDSGRAAVIAGKGKFFDLIQDCNKYLLSNFNFKADKTNE